MKKLILILIALLIASNSFAQSNNPSITWIQPEVNAQTFNYTLKIDTANPITLTAVCSNGSCIAPFVLTNPTAQHTYTLTASNDFGSATATLGPGAPPTTSGIKVVVTVTITQSSN